MQSMLPHPYLSKLLRVLQEFVLQELLDAPSLLGSQALVNEVSKVCAPFFGNTLNRLLKCGVEKFVQFLLGKPISVRWHARG